MKYELGDIIISGSKKNNWLGQAIRLFTRSPGEPPTRATHVAMVVHGADKLKDVQALEAVARGVKIQRYGRPYRCLVYRPRDLTEGYCLLSEALKVKGTRYGYVRILAHGLDWITTKGKLNSYRFRKMVKGGDLAGRECSNVIAYLWSKCRGLGFGVPAYGASPDDIDDYCSWSPRKYLVIRPWDRYKGRKED